MTVAHSEQTPRARYLNPNTGRFWSMDSWENGIEDPISLHKYIYGEGNPVDNVDPSGHEIGELLIVMVVVVIVADVYISHIPPAAKIAQKALIAGGTPANIAKRKKIDETARKYIGSHLWDYDVRKDDFPPESNKCNKFVYDVAKEAGAEALVTIKTPRGMVSRQPLAAEYADTNTKIPNWRSLGAGENPQPGDVAAFKLQGGGTRYSGHSGLIVVGGNVSAHDDGVYGKPGQFENDPNTHYRRYTGN